MNTTSATSWTRTFYWGVQRELWEYRSIYLAPLAVAGVYLAAFLVSAVFRLPEQMRTAIADPALMKHLGMSYEFAASVILMAAMIVQIYYCLDALQSERRDRSILFWKSLPVSDAMTVLTKAAIAMLVLPAIGFCIVIATGIVMLIGSSLVLAVSGLNPGPLWTQLSLAKNSWGLFTHIATVHVLWYAPFYGWFLFVSVWSRRAALLWAVLPGFMLGIAEKFVFNTTYFAHLVQVRFMGSMDSAAMNGTMGINGDFAGWQDFLGKPGMWGGLLLTAGFLICAIWIRKNREAS